MALDRILGPVTLTLDPDETHAGPAAVGFEKRASMWLDDYGLVGYTSANDLGFDSTAVCNLDGVVYMVGNTRNSGSGNGANLYYDFHHGGCNAWETGQSGRYWWPITGRYDDDNYLDATVGGVGQTRATIVLPDRYLGTGLDGGEADEVLVSAPLDSVSTGDFTTEYTFSPVLTTGSNAGIMSPGREGTVFIWTGAEIVEYDYINQTEVLPRRTFDFAISGAVWYSPRFDFFVVLHNTAADQDDLYVYANEFVPDSLSAPVALTPITQGRVSTIQTTLTDDAGVGIPDRRIDWSITVGNGTLSTTQSVTDEDGVASVDYRAELSGGVNPTIEASLTF